MATKLVCPRPTPRVKLQPTPLPTPAPPPPPTPTPIVRARAPSLTDYQRDSERKSSPPVAARRKELRTWVASAVGVAWFICICAVGESALRALFKI